MDLLFIGTQLQVINYHHIWVLTSCHIHQPTSRLLFNWCLLSQDSNYHATNLPSHFKVFSLLVYSLSIKSHSRLDLTRTMTLNLLQTLGGPLNAKQLVSSNKCINIKTSANRKSHRVHLLVFISLYNMIQWVGGVGFLFCFFFVQSVKCRTERGNN